MSKQGMFLAACITMCLVMRGDLTSSSQDGKSRTRDEDTLTRSVHLSGDGRR